MESIKELTESILKIRDIQINVNRNDFSEESLSDIQKLMLYRITLISLVLGATHLDESRRYPSAREFRAALEEEQRQHSAWSLASMMHEMFGLELDRERTDLAEAAERALKEP